MPAINSTCYVLADECIGCKICAEQCPWDAIQMVRYEAPKPAIVGAGERLA